MPYMQIIYSYMEKLKPSSFGECFRRPGCHTGHAGGIPPPVNRGKQVDSVPGAAVPPDKNGSWRNGHRPMTRPPEELPDSGLTGRRRAAPGTGGSGHPRPPRQRQQDHTRSTLR